MLWLRFNVYVYVILARVVLQVQHLKMQILSSVFSFDSHFDSC